MQLDFSKLPAHLQEKAKRRLWFCANDYWQDYIDELATKPAAVIEALLTDLVTPDPLEQDCSKTDSF